MLHAHRRRGPITQEKTTTGRAKCAITTSPAFHFLAVVATATPRSPSSPVLSEDPSFHGARFAETMCLRARCWAAGLLGRRRRVSRKKPVICCFRDHATVWPDVSSQV